MRALLITNIGELTTNADTAGDALVVTDKVEWAGPSHAAPPSDDRLDAAGCAVLPGFVDSHSHLIFAGDRAEEFAARMAGEPYTGGGIRTTVAATRAAGDDELRRNARRLVAEMRRQGTTTIEIKSGYGLTTHDEQRSVRIAGELTEEVTYLGAHITPDGVRDYISEVTGPMLRACAPYARWVDVFCERGAFDAAAARTILKAGIAAGLQPRIHANQLSQGDGVQLAVELDCASADHCTHLSDADVDALAGSNTVATLLPGAEFSCPSHGVAGWPPDSDAPRATYPDARRLREAGATVALATDCNPGSSYTSSMPFCIALAVREMGMTPREAVWAATAGGAQALRRTDIGHLGLGARADLIMLDAPSALHLAYRPGVPLVKQVIHGGTVL